MDEVSIIGLDLAKRVFQVHGASSSEDVVFRRERNRSGVGTVRISVCGRGIMGEKDSHYVSTQRNHDTE